ncbi:hypothetical protein BDQ17DRAFT_1382674 [Cyathus striatus]|nr:hypothetical protein BDQ17DRAFT_1382674 [Cyathus striatus]
MATNHGRYSTSPFGHSKPVTTIINRQHGICQASISPFYSADRFRVLGIPWNFTRWHTG